MKVIHLTEVELDELGGCVVGLKSVLRTLDKIGAGIAAIHVDAAINQLQLNIEDMTQRQAASRSDPLDCLSEHPLQNL